MLRISLGRENTVRKCTVKIPHKRTHAVQTHIAQESITFEKVVTLTSVPISSNLIFH